MVEVTMTLPESAVEDAVELTDAFHMESKTATVCTALGLTRKIAALAGPKGHLIVQNGDGKATKLNIERLFETA